MEGKNVQLDCITVIDLEFHTQRSLTRPSVIDEQGMPLETRPEEDA